MTPRSLLSCSQRAERISGAAVFVYVAAAVGLLFAIGVPPVMRFGHDCFIFLDGAYRLRLGQTIHVDFHSALGAITPWIFSLGMRLVGTNVHGLLAGVALFTVATSAWAWAVGRQRLAPALNAAFVALVAATGFGLYTLGFEYFETSFASIFNRFSYAILLVLLVECLVAPPQETSRRGLVLAGVSTGFAGIALFFLKPSYVAPAALFFIVGVGVVSRSRQRALGVVAGVVLGVVAFGAIFHFRYLAMAADVFDAMDARAGHFGEGSQASLFHQMLRRDGFSMTAAKLLEIFRLELVPNLMLLTAAVVVPAKTRALIDVYASRRTIVVTAVLVVGSAFPIVFSNWQWSEVPTTAAFGIALVEYARRADAAEGAPWRLAVVAWLGAMLVLPHLGKDFASLAFALAEKDQHTRAAEVDTPPMHGLKIVSSDGYCRPRAYPARIEGGIKLIEPLVGARRPKVLVLDFSNPFSFAMQLEPPRGGLLWWHLGATFNDKATPPGRDVFADVDIVMIPKCPEEVPTTQALTRIYQADLARFERGAENDDWILLTRPTR